MMLSKKSEMKSPRFTKKLQCENERVPAGAKIGSGFLYLERPTETKKRMFYFQYCFILKSQLFLNQSKF